MAPATEAPQQFKQPSRKGKKAWRKNVDITDEQEGLRLLREEEIKGGVIAEKPSEDLFTLDTTGSREIEKTVRKSKKPLKSDEILAQRSVIPAVDSRKRPNSKVTDGIIEPKTKRTKSDWVSDKELKRLKQVASNAGSVQRREPGDVSYDPWGEETKEAENFEDPRFSFLKKQKKKVAPVTLKHAPISLTASGKPVPAVKNPHAGTSYNPAFQDWDALLQAEGEKAVAAEKQRLEDERREQERQRLIEEAKDKDGEVKSDDESAWEGFESEYEKPEWLNKKRPERKTKTQRNKIKRRKEAERQAKWEAQMKKRELQAQKIGEIADKVVEDHERRETQDGAEAESSDDSDGEVLRRRPLGKNRIPEKPLELVLPEELQDSLRLLKPEGNLLGDRFRTLMVQGKLEARTPVVQSKKPKRKATEKWTHKDFQI